MEKNLIVSENRIESEYFNLNGNALVSLVCMCMYWYKILSNMLMLTSYMLKERLVSNGIHTNRK